MSPVRDTLCSRITVSVKIKVFGFFLTIFWPVAVYVRVFCTTPAVVLHRTCRIFVLPHHSWWKEMGPNDPISLTLHPRGKILEKACGWLISKCFLKTRWIFITVQQSFFLVKILPSAFEDGDFDLLHNTIGRSRIGRVHLLAYNTLHMLLVRQWWWGKQHPTLFASYWLLFSDLQRERQFPSSETQQFMRGLGWAPVHVFVPNSRGWKTVMIH